MSAEEQQPCQAAPNVFMDYDHHKYVGSLQFVAARMQSFKNIQVARSRRVAHDQAAGLCDGNIFDFKELIHRIRIDKIR